MIKPLLFVGHVSPFGETFLRKVLVSPYFEIKMVVIPEEELYINFMRRLQQVDRLEDEWKYRRSYRHKTSAIRKWIKVKAPNINLRTSADLREDRIQILAKQFELAFCAAYPAIFPESLITTVKKGVVNFHPSYLPRCRGANPIYWTIASQEPFGGVSAHYMTNKIDAGPILAQEKIPFDQKTITYQDLYQLVIQKIEPLLQNTAAFLDADREPLKQDEHAKSFFRENLTIHHLINWSQEPVERISAKIRAGGAFSFHKKDKVWLSSIVQISNHVPFVTNERFVQLKPGTVVRVQSSTIWIKALNQYIAVEYRKRKTLEDLLISMLKILGLKRWIPRFSLLHQRIIEVGDILQ